MGKEDFLSNFYQLRSVNHRHWNGSDVLQARVGVKGMPRQFIDYPNEFAQAQLYSGLAAIACLSLATAYVVYLWRCSKTLEKAEDVF